MAGRVHSKLTVWKIGANDISQYCNSSSIEDKVDSHDTTTYGLGAHRYEGGLDDGSVSLGGFYDSQATTGPRPVFKAAKGTTVEVTHQPEGAGTGKPQDVFDALVVSYKEDKPIADYVTWTAELQISSVIDDTAQS